MAGFFAALFLLTVAFVVKKGRKKKLINVWCDITMEVLPHLPAWSSLPAAPREGSLISLTRVKSLPVLWQCAATHHQLLSSCRGHHHSLGLGGVGVFGVGSDLQVFLVIQVKLWKRSSFWSLECVEELLDLVGHLPSAGSSPILWKMIESVSPPV